MPYPGSRKVRPLDVSGGIFIETCPLRVGTEISVPRAASCAATGSVTYRSSPLRSKRGSGRTAIRR